MSMVCPRCNATFDDRQHCPTCGIRLVSTDPAAEGSGVLVSGKWQQTAWGRGVVGLLLTQGLYYGFWQLGTAVVMASVGQSEHGDWWSTPTGWIVMQCLQAISLLAGGMLAGSGQRYGTLYGALLGLVNGVLFVVVQVGIGHQFEAMELAGQPLGQLVVGAIGGLIGSRIWRPMMPIAVVPSTNTSSMFQRPLPVGSANRGGNTGFSGPIAWIRVVGGTVLALVGSAWASLILRLMLDYGQGTLSVESTRHAKFVTWEISALALMLGAAAAGATTRNGLKQGLIVGIGTALGLLAIHIQLGTEASQPAQTLCFQLLGVAQDSLPLGNTILYTLVTVIPIGALGGWFGGQLLPPLAKSRSGRGLFAARA
ncbi:MAG: hypothetical protein K2R98_07005 [Gemmataceae bacterium]|nr:hypothetical protein [Gemmataceae bacterium]